MFDEVPDSGFYLLSLFYVFFFFNRVPCNRDSNGVCFIAHLCDTLLVVEEYECEVCYVNFPSYI